MKFEILKKDPGSNARTGKLQTNHGEINTPIFMPVGTSGTVKGIHQKELEEIIDAEIILGNTYHLYLRPGTEIISQAGGLHRFISWNRPILTDSGGYQVYSLSNTRKIKEEGVTFSSHIDGSKHFFTPEYAIEVQQKIGADIIMAFDECTPYPCEYNYATESMHLTHRWLDRCINQMAKNEETYGYSQYLSPIVQGSVYKDLRIQSAEYIAEKNAPINAIGGLSVGEPHEDMYSMTEVVCNILPQDKPRYLMGVGTPSNLLESISLGIDMFDCVLPTRNARHGLIYTMDGIINIKNAKWSTDFSPLDSTPGLGYSNRYSKAYLRHLFQVKELLAAQIASVHNLSFYLFLIKEARKHINNGDFSLWKSSIYNKLKERL